MKISSNDIITIPEQLYLLYWIYKNKRKFIPNLKGPNRKWMDINFENSPKLIWDIRNRIILKENLIDYKEELSIGNIITCGLQNSFIHPHTDNSSDNYDHIRYNLCLLKPFDGGDCFYNNEKFFLKERRYIKCNASKIHYTTPVIGIKPRIIISYGFLTKK